MARVSTYTAATSVSGGDHLYLVQNGTSYKVAVSVLLASPAANLVTTSAALATSIASAFSAIASVSVAVRANVATVSAALATSIASHNHAITSISGTGAFGLTMAQVETAVSANLLLMPTVTVSGDIALTSFHESKFLLCVTNVNLTVNAATEFSPQGFCIIGAEGGDVNLVNAVTINRPGTDNLTVQQYGEAMLRRTQTADVYTLKGTLGTA